MKIHQIRMSYMYYVYIFPFADTVCVGAYMYLLLDLLSKSQKTADKLKEADYRLLS